MKIQYYPVPEIHNNETSYCRHSNLNVYKVIFLFRYNEISQIFLYTLGSHRQLHVYSVHAPYHSVLERYAWLLLLVR